MIPLSAWADGARALAALSGLGRRCARRLLRLSPGDGGASSKALLADAWERRLLLANFQTCDSAFIRFVPPGIEGAAGTDRQRLYDRLVPFAWINQALRTRLFEAFDLPYDRPAEERSVVHSFNHREWNDLLDVRGFALSDLYRAISLQESAPPALQLLRHFTVVWRELAPPTAFPGYYALIRESPRAYEIPTTAPGAREATARQALFSCRMFILAMREGVPDVLETVLPAFGLWLYGLDQLSDLEEDRRSGRKTWLGSVADPAAEIERLLADCRSRIEAAAPHPRRLLIFMETMTRGVLHLRRRGKTIEDLYFGAAS